MTSRLWIAVAAEAAGCAAGAGLPVYVPATGACLAGALFALRRPSLRLIALAAASFVAGSMAARAAPADGPHNLGGPAVTARTSLERSAEVLDRREAALLQGLALGGTAGFDDATLESFRRSGLAHIVAVSGTNVAIVAGTFMAIAVRAGRRVRAAVALGAIVVYVAAVGPEPSVLRAAAMGGVTLVAFASGFRTDPLNALALALIVLLGVRPTLVSSVGLHLSVAATAGIVMWARPLARVLRRAGIIAAPLAVTLAAQAAVTPLLVGAFGRVSVTGPLANLLALPAVVPATLGGLAATLTGLLSDSAARVVARASAPFLTWILWVADALGRPEWAAAAVPRAAAWPLATLALGFAYGARETRRG